MELFNELFISQPHNDAGINSLVVSADGKYCSYCGIWYDRNTEFAMIEPVAIDPDFRSMGFAGAAVLESINKCSTLGAKKSLSRFLPAVLLPVGISSFAGKNLPGEEIAIIILF